MDFYGMFANVGVLAILCFICGFLLVILEMHIPGFGAPGITGTILLVIGVVLTARNMMEGLFLIAVMLVVLGIMLAVVLHSATKGKLAQKVILTESLNKESGFSGTEDLSYFLGKVGKTLTVLRPAGMADFEGVKLDVVSEGEYISQNVDVQVLKVEGRRIIVREIKKI